MIHTNIWIGNSCVRIRILFLIFILASPKSTLFPYTTLFRSLSRQPHRRSTARRPPRRRRTDRRGRLDSGRSEEHTSELQSRENLVCRLLLEKKKIKLKAGSGSSGSSRILGDAHLRSPSGALD